jgi:hypothetical protein
MCSLAGAIEESFPRMLPCLTHHVSRSLRAVPYVPVIAMNVYAPHVHVQFP